MAAGSLPPRTNVTADTELEAPAALADGQANPTISRVGSAGLLWNGATWDRTPGNTLGQFVQGPVADDAAAGTERPVPVGGKYNATFPTYTDLDRTQLQMGSRGATRVQLHAVDSTTGVGAITPADADGAAAGLQVVARPQWWDGAQFQRARGNTLGQYVQGHLAHDAVDAGNPTKIGGKAIAAAGTPAFVSATGDRVDGAFDAAGRLMVMEPVTWTVSHAPAANTQAVASKAAGGAGVKHVLTSLFAQCHNSGAATAAVLIVNVRDGATGAGTVLWTFRIPITATTLLSREIFLNDLNIVGTAATAMTVEFSAAGGANTNEIVNITGYDTF